MTEAHSPAPQRSVPAERGTHRILVVEDEEPLALGVRDALRHAGHQVEICGNGRVALDLVRRENFDLVVLDLMLPGMNGLDVLRALREGDILAYLSSNRDRVVTREDLLLDVWHYRNPNVGTRTVDIHIVGLRRKIEPDAANPKVVQTVRGKGYRWFS